MTNIENLEQENALLQKEFLADYNKLCANNEDHDPFELWKAGRFRSNSTEAAKPVAYAVISELGGVHKLSITKESANRKASTWKKEWPNNQCQVVPLYSPPQPIADALDAELMNWLEKDMQLGDDGTGIYYEDCKFCFPYLVNGSPIGGGVGLAKFDSLRAAIAAAREKKE